MKKSIYIAAFLIGLGIFVVALLGPYLFGEKVLLTTDAAIAGSNIPPGELFPKLAYGWNARPLLGAGGAMFWKLPAVLMLFIHGILWNNLVYPVACALSSVAFYFLFRKKGIGVAAVAMGGIAAFWVGSNFTLIYPGHMLKPYVILFFVLSLLPVERAAKGSIPAGLIWGSCVGLMFINQPDIALFCALFSGAYLVFKLVKNQGLKLVSLLKVLLPAAVIAFLFAAGPLLNGYERHVKGAAQIQTDNKVEKWNYITQWSFPPEESIDFIAPGYTGWRSGEPEGPYWGRMGRSADWEKTKQGFRNFKLESTYLGLIPFVFGIYALYSCRRSKFKAEILFWGLVALAALLLSFGKFFPLYGLVYKLPVINNIRNPNKFLQVFQVCVAILSVFGFHLLFGSREADEQQQQSKSNRYFFWGLVGLFGLLVLGGIGLALGHTAELTQLTKAGWPADAAKVIISNKSSALIHAAIMTAVVGVVFLIFSFPRFENLKRFKAWFMVALVLIVAADAVKLSKHYLKEMPRSYVEANALTEFLSANIGDQRAAFITQQGIHGVFVTYLLPFNRIPTFNYSDMPRMASEYKALLSAGQRDPLGMWRFSAVKYVLGPTSSEKQLEAAKCKKVFAYGVASDGDGGFKVVPQVNGPLAVYELQGALPRYALFAGSRKGADQDALAAMADFSQVVLPPDSPLPELSGSGLSGSVQVVKYREGKVELLVNTSQPAILRCADRYDRGWKAKIDGERAGVERVDFLCQGVFIPAGEHTVVLRYAPSKHFFYMQLLGYTLLLFSMVYVARQPTSDHVAD